MQIDIENLNELVTKADGIFLTPKGEETLVQLLDIQKKVEDAINTAKTVLEQAALKLNRDFKSIQGDKIKVAYRYYGSQYYLDETLVAEVDPELYKVTKRYSVNTKAVEEWVETHKGMPLGIKEVERKKQIAFSMKGGKNGK